MKITFVLSYAGLAGGVRVVGIHADRLRRRGHDVCIVSRKHPKLGRRALARYVWHRARLRLAGKPATLSHLTGLDVEHRQIGPRVELTDEHVPDADVIIGTWWETAEEIARLSPSKGAKALFAQGFETHAGQPADRVRATWRLPFHKIVVSQWLVNIARDEFADTEVSLVPNSVDLDLFTTPQRQKQPVPTVGMMYVPKLYKGCDLCAQAVELARRVVPDLRFVTFGVNQPTPEIPLPANTEFRQHPPQSEIVEMYASCDAWLTGSRQEGFGLPILEAMACRTPVVATPAGAARELTVDDAGVLVDFDDAQAMADAIVRITQQSEADWKRMSDAAHVRATTYTWDDAADLFEQAVHHAAAKGSDPFVGERAA